MVHDPFVRSFLVFHLLVLKLPGCGGATMPHGDADAESYFPSNRGWRSICAMMAGSAAETLVFGDHDRWGGSVDRERVQKRPSLRAPRRQRQ